VALLLAIGFPPFTIPRLDSNQPGFSFVLIVILGAFLYFLPSIISGYRRETRFPVVLGVNLLLGWNLFAWFATLVFAVYGQTQTQAKAKLLARQRLPIARSENPALSEDPLLSSYRRDSEPDPTPAHHDPRGPVAVILGAAALLVFLAASGLANRLTSDGSPAIRIINAMTISHDVAVPDELASQATFQDIINQCGQPERRWITNSGQGTSLQTVDHLFYSRIPAEIRLSIRPNENREQSRHWTFAGAAASPDSTSTYSGQQLKERMPCMTQWADVLAAREAQNLNGKIY
jgi:hypothetical protein